MPDEIQKLLSNCADHLKPIITPALHTGMRKSELLGLKWDQVNFEQGTITLLDTKNGESRDIHMDETVKTLLEAMEKKGPYSSSMKADPFTVSKNLFETAFKKSGIRGLSFS